MRTDADGRDQNQLIGSLNRHDSQQQFVCDAEDRGVRADAERELSDPRRSR
jgi:YD repeat-containing protein